MGPSPIRLAAVAGAALLAAALPAAPVAAGTTHSISVSPTSAKPGDTVTVSGTSDCASSGYTVTLSYTDPEGNTQTATASGTTDAAGEYTQAVTVHEHATAEEPASVQSNIPSCDGGAAAASNTVALTVVAHTGTFTISPTSGPSGTTVTFSGANCWGDDVAVVFTDSEFDAFVEAEDVTLNEDRTFSGSFVVPGEAGPGDYFFVAECPGTDFPNRAFRVTASATDGGGTPPPAPPAVPVPGTVRFTG